MTYQLGNNPRAFDFIYFVLLGLIVTQNEIKLFSQKLEMLIYTEL